MIKPIDKIPQSLADRQKSYREMIREDIRQAIDQGIRAFEFEGEYNYRYLAQYAREEADGFFRQQLWTIIKQRKKAGFDDPSIAWWHINRVDGLPIYKVTSRKTEDKNRPRVFCELWPQNLEQAYMKLVETENRRNAERRERNALRTAEKREDGNEKNG